MSAPPGQAELALGARPRSPGAWRLLRLLDEEAGVSWVWTGFRAHIEQRLGLQGKLALAELATEGCIRVERHRRRSDAEGRLVVHLISPHRERFVALLRMIQSGESLLRCDPACDAHGPGRARCVLSPAHDGQHPDSGHPALRRGEILRWERETP